MNRIPTMLQFFTKTFFNLDSPFKKNVSDVTVNVDALINDRDRFNAFVYTPFEIAITELQNRRRDTVLEGKIKGLTANDIPEPFTKAPRLTLLRYINTPNHEIIRFLHLTGDIQGLRPLLCEYTTDKFVPSNILKRFLGKIAFYKKRHPNGTLEMDRLEIIDFEKSQNQKISEIKTLWGESLVEFHHSFFLNAYPQTTKEDWYDISKWYKQHGPAAQKYYIDLLALFIRDGILFENFVLQDKEEVAFLKEIFFPAFLKVYQETKMKPLIVALEPTEIEGEKFWLCYPFSDKQYVEKKLTNLITHHGA